MRYLLSRKSHSAVNIISAISVAGVAVATAAIVIVLSVFNGFSDLASSHLAAIDPDIKIVPAKGKTIADADALCHELMEQDIVAEAMPTIQERGLAIVGNAQMPVMIKGVPDSYSSLVGIDSLVIDGAYVTEQQMAEAYPEIDERPMLLSVGAAISTGVRPGDAQALSLYVPKRIGRINPANPATAFREVRLLPTGVFRVNQPEYDNDLVVVPISAARELLEYDTEATAIELKLAPGVSQEKAAKQLSSMLPPGLNALTQARQEEKSFKMIQMEKWITFLMLAFILVIASFNIVSTLSLLVIEKRDNMATLRAMGATRSLVRRVFMWQGCIISIAGGVAGIALGSLLSVAQQYGGFIKLSGDPSQLTIAVYPVHLLAGDLLIVFGLVCLIALGASQITRLFKTP